MFAAVATPFARNTPRVAIADWTKKAFSTGTSRPATAAVAAAYSDMPHSTASPSLRLSSQNLPQIQKQVASVPTYDRKNVKHGIVHVGVGGFHRAHLAVYVDRLLQKFNLRDWSICGVGITRFDTAIRDALKPQDYLYTLIERSEKGTDAHVIGSITDYLFAPGNEESVIAKMANEDTKIVSMTITESGYYYNENTHELDTENLDIQHDLTTENPPKTIYGYLYAAQKRRFEAGLPPFTVMSCDNMQKNGSITRNMLLSFASKKNIEVASWLGANGAFPNSMVDRITPRTVENDITSLSEEFAVEDAWPVVTEPFMQWVLEDSFSAGRPAFEDVGVQVVPTIEKVEEFEMWKLRLLNASHSALAYPSFLAGIEYVHEVMADPLFRRFIENMMHLEVKPLLPAIPGVDVDQYINTLIQRFSNPTLKDEVARLCLGGSGKFPQFIMPSVAEQIRAGGPLNRLTLGVAGWFRYNQGIDEHGNEYKVNDPRAEELTNLARKGGRRPTDLLAIADLFGDDLRHDVRFVSELAVALDSLYEVGARKTMEKYA